MVLLLFTINSMAQSTKTIVKLPDTGQINSYTNTFGEDNDYTINPPSFIDNLNGTIVDVVSGLLWQKTDGGEMTFNLANQYCDTLSLAGFNDWRLPNALESYSILDLQHLNPALQTSFFDITGAEYWWTSAKQANDTNKIWCTNAGGGIGNHPRSETISAGGTKKFHVRAVRDINIPSTIYTRMLNNADGTITDSLTYLMWTELPSNIALNWEDALNYAENLQLSGYNDWRLPNIKELQSLTNTNTIQPAVFLPYFQNYAVNKYWSATSLSNQSSKAWYWHTAYGITTYDIKTNTNYVVCVRNISTSPNYIPAVHAVRTNIVRQTEFSTHILINDNYKNKFARLFNMQGQLLYEGNNIENFSCQTLLAGIYILCIDNQSIKLTKF